jgi:hypothetical protein
MTWDAQAYVRGVLLRDYDNTPASDAALTAQEARTDPLDADLTFESSERLEALRTPEVVLSRREADTLLAAVMGDHFLVKDLDAAIDKLLN